MSFEQRWPTPRLQYFVGKPLLFWMEGPSVERAESEQGSESVLVSLLFETVKVPRELIFLCLPTQ